ncbi:MULTISPECIES: NAD(P)H-binding protein [Pseudomonas syringae group]|uniref:NAD(P)H-binding protein n=1 Tax=Pseudomonas syringae group TaxID=136849 RepID=UPI000F0678B1|nr:MULTISPECIES: NAD(P)H-binding protein [Pseudomonas syringae group]MCF5225841.1 NAD(P)H-binding protein [Pseudomonas syringae]MCF5243328.1 NAD(P)H-binding protein [Pseudomonas syringae]
MSRVFVIGAAGKVGQRLIKKLGDGGHEVIALHRKEEQSVLIKAAGALPLLANLVEMDAAALSSAMAGSDVVVFTAGAGGAGIELTSAIDGEGLKTSVAAAELAGVRRFLLVSAFPEAARGTDIGAGFENYMRVKKDADVCLASSALDWVILRPGTLVDSAGSGQVRAGLAIPYGDIPRDDVAAFLAALVDQPEISRQIIELTEGTTPVELAIKALGTR